MEPIPTQSQTQAQEIHRGTDDAVFVSCTAMFALAIVFAAGSLNNRIDMGMMAVDMPEQNTATLIQATVVVPAAEPTIEQELDTVAKLLEVKSVTATH
jgi:maleate cis-trans isomerase